MSGLAWSDCVSRQSLTYDNAQIRRSQFCESKRICARFCLSRFICASALVLDVSRRNQPVPPPFTWSLGSVILATLGKLGAGIGLDAAGALASTWLAWCK